jgi:hypothetical protein
MEEMATRTTMATTTMESAMAGNNGRNCNNNFTARDISQVQCFNCNKLGHYANDCPEAKKDSGNTNGSKPNPFQKGHVNHLDVEEIMDEPDAVIFVIGMFLINTFPTLVLFDTGASHSFISTEFVDGHKLPIESMRTPLRVNSPMGELVAAYGCRQLNLEIGKHNFPTSLFVLESQGLDVILGMDWMTTYEGVIECQASNYAHNPREEENPLQINF